MIISLKEFIEDGFEKTTEGLFFLKVKIKSAIVDAKIENNSVNVEFEYLTESDHPNYQIINALAKSILSEWKE